MMRGGMVVEVVNQLFNGFIGLGGAAMMFIVLTLLALVFRVKLAKAFEGGLRMAMALTGMGAIISLLSSAFAPALKQFVESTGIALSITDLGWAPLAVITWGSIYTLNVDFFNIRNVSIIGLLINYYSHSFVAASIFVLFFYTAMLKNADTMKPTINKVLNFDETNITTTAHPLFLISPFLMILK